MRQDITVLTGLFLESLKVQPKGEVHRGSVKPIIHYRAGSILCRRGNYKRGTNIPSDGGV
jgi:hypothetical protein